jgi:hypothetical protein
MAPIKKIGSKGLKSKTNSKSDKKILSIKKKFSKENINILTKRYGSLNINKLKSFVSTGLIIYIIFLIIAITIISLIINYLTKLKNCDCFIDKNDQNKSRITFLIVIEIIVLISLIFILLSSLTVLYLIKTGGGEYEGLYIYIMVFSILIILVQLYFIYCVYELSKNIRNDCDCAKSWVRYLLYLQSIFIAITIISNITKFFIKK